MILFPAESLQEAELPVESLQEAASDGQSWQVIIMHISLDRKLIVTHSLRSKV